MLSTFLKNLHCAKDQSLSVETQEEQHSLKYLPTAAARFRDKSSAFSCRGWMTSGDSGLSHSQLLSRAQDTQPGGRTGLRTAHCAPEPCSGTCGGCSCTAATQPFQRDSAISIPSPLTEQSVFCLPDQAQRLPSINSFGRVTSVPLLRSFICISPVLPSPWTAIEAAQPGARHRPVPCRCSPVSRHSPGRVGQERSQGWLQGVLCWQRGSFTPLPNAAFIQVLLQPLQGFLGLTPARERALELSSSHSSSVRGPTASNPDGPCQGRQQLPGAHTAPRNCPPWRRLSHPDISALGSTTTTEAHSQSL